MRRKFERRFTKHGSRCVSRPHNLNDTQIARFRKNYSGRPRRGPGVAIRRQLSARDDGAHLLGYVLRDNSSAEGEDAFFLVRLPIIAASWALNPVFDPLWRGRAGAEAVLVNNLGTARPKTCGACRAGAQCVLTIDLDIHQAGEHSLVAHRAPTPAPHCRDGTVRHGDVLGHGVVAGVDPAIWPKAVFSPGELGAPQRPTLRPQINRATLKTYAPGSIFKPIIGLPRSKTDWTDALVDSPGYVYVGRRHIGIWAPPGQYNFRRAIIQSCNTYFITIGLRAASKTSSGWARNLILATALDLPTRQETPGILPTSPGCIRAGHDGDNGQPVHRAGRNRRDAMQMAVAYAGHRKRRARCFGRDWWNASNCRTRHQARR